MRDLKKIQGLTMVINSFLPPPKKKGDENNAKVGIKSLETFLVENLMFVMEAHHLFSLMINILVVITRKLLNLTC